MEKISYRIFLLFFLLFNFSLVTLAEFKTKVTGAFDFQSGVRNQKKLIGSQRNLSSNNKNLAFSTSANVKLEISNTTDQDIKYGGRVVLTTTTKLDTGTSANNSHIFIEGEFGRIEVGSPPVVATTMRIQALDVTQSTKTSWSDYIKLNPHSHYGYEFIKYSFPLLGAVPRAVSEKSSQEAARNVTYYTPKYNGLQFGISYIPDTANNGKFKISKDMSNIMEVKNGKNSYKIKVAAKNLVTTGIKYEYKISDVATLKTSLTGEFGKAVQKQVGSDQKLTGDKKLDDLKSYNIGFILNYDKFSYGLSYANAGKSLSSKDIYHNRKRKFQIYSAGISYVPNVFGFSLTYLNTNFNENKLNAVTLGTSYKGISGLLPYAEVSFINTKGIYFKDSKQNQKHKIVVGILGLKLNF